MLTSNGSGYLALRPVNKSFHACTGTPLDIAGQVLIDVEHNDQQKTLPLVIVRLKSMPLLYLEGHG